MNTSSIIEKAVIHIHAYNNKYLLVILPKPKFKRFLFINWLFLYLIRNTNNIFPADKYSDIIYYNKLVIIIIDPYHLYQWNILWR